MRLPTLLPSRATVQLALNPAPVAVPGPTATTPGFGTWSPWRNGVAGIGDQVLAGQLERVNYSAGMSIPAVRRAVHVIAGTLSTFGLSAWNAAGQRLERSDSSRPVWLDQPDPTRPLANTLYRTVVDAIWRDRSVWKILDRDVWGRPVAFRHVPGELVDYLRDTADPDEITGITINGAPVALRDVVLFDWAGVGGLARFGWDILDLYATLQAAAGTYAKAPHPKAILKNHGADLLDDEIDALLAGWESARSARSVGYLNDVMDYETFGWNAADLQLTEAREHAALEVARLFGLPARAVDAAGGDSMTYANVTEARIDTLESLRPWMTPLEQTLSLDDRTGVTAGMYTARGTVIRFNADAYVRDQPAARMQTWQTAIASGVLTVDEARHWEPLASSTVEAP